MKKNVTIVMDDALLKKGRQLAMDHDQSLSDLVSNLIANAGRGGDFQRCKAKALRFLKKGFNLGGKPFSRDEMHER